MLLRTLRLQTIIMRFFLVFNCGNYLKKEILLYKSLLSFLQNILKYLIQWMETEAASLCFKIDTHYLFCLLIIFLWFKLHKSKSKFASRFTSAQSVCAPLACRGGCWPEHQLVAVFCSTCIVLLWFLHDVHEYKSFILPCETVNQDNL